jgi:hypothetical protein
MMKSSKSDQDQFREPLLTIGAGFGSCERPLECSTPLYE